MVKKNIKTFKKQKLVGFTELYDKDGNPIPSQIVTVEDRDFNFHKVWLEHLIMAFDGITNQKLKLAFWIINNLDYENKLVMTQRTIAEKSGMGIATVSRTMRELQQGEIPFLQRINSGAYRVNPAVIWKGGHNKRMSVIFQYTNTAKTQPIILDNQTSISNKNIEDVDTQELDKAV